MEKNLVDSRREEIIDACEKLYKEIGFKSVNIKLIGENISCSRTSIYNYFETKEEIFLALVEREYLKWNKDLSKINDRENKISTDEFINKIVSSLSKRKILLKLISMNMYEMEENSSYESVKSYKIAYTESVNLFKKCLIKLLNYSEEAATKISFTFFPFMIGIYPYSAVTEKQKKALKELDFKYNYYNIEELIKMGLKNILGGKKMSKILVSYFSASGVTKIKAESFAKEVEGDLYEIIPKHIYTDDDLNWHDSNSRSSIEIKDKDLRPEIEDITIDVNSYDTIYVGFPIWWGIAPNVVKTFMDQIDLSNKKIITFCTSGGSSLEPATEDLKANYPDANIENGRRL